ncbi:hypothetical protein FI667_g1689, partial [Globisporangium splendens]
MHEFKTDVAYWITAVCEETNNLRMHWQKQVDDMTERLQEFDTTAQKQAIESRAQTQQRIGDMELMEQAFSTLQKQQLHVRTNLEDHVQSMSSQTSLIVKKMEVLESQCSSQKAAIEQIKSKSASIEKEQRRRMENISNMFSKKTDLVCFDGGFWLQVFAEALNMSPNAVGRIA